MGNLTEMRTRILTDMTNGEAEEYLDRNDIMFLPMGAVETHGGLPLDCETVIAEAFAIKMAKETDGLIFPNLSYLYPGGTVIGRGTVRMSITEGISFLKSISRSLINQGFKRQIYLSFHAPSYMTASPVVREIFEETKVPILYIDMMQAMKSVKMNYDDFNNLFYGAYLIMGKLDAVPLNVPESNSQTYQPDKKSTTEFMKSLFDLAYFSGAIGYYITNPWEHCSTPLIRTASERLERAQHGAEMISEIVSGMNMNNVIDTMRSVEEYTSEIIKTHPFLASQGKV